MPTFDLPVHQLREYTPDLFEPPDLREFWSKTLRATAEHPVNAQLVAVDGPLRTVDAFDVTFGGYLGQQVKGWLLLPRGRTGPLPVVVEYIGYGGGRGLLHESLQWSAFGYAHFVMDTRGQGSDGRVGATPDWPGEARPHVPGFLTLGLPERDAYYYRRVYVDAVRAVDAACAHPDVDRARVVAMGNSQGGALAVASSILRSWVLDQPVAAVLSDVPFLSDIRRGSEIAPEAPYTELVRWCATHRDLAPAAFATLASFDIAVLARHGWSPALFSAGLRDPVCPPSTVFAAFNRYTGADKDIRVWEWSEHEAGRGHHVLEQLAWLSGRVPPGI